VPENYGSGATIRLIGIVDPGAASTLRNIDFTTNYSSLGEDYQTHVQTDTASTYDLSGTGDQLYSFDLTSLFSNITAGDLCGIYVKHNSIGNSIYYLGVSISYNE